MEKKEMPTASTTLPKGDHQTNENCGAAGNGIEEDIIVLTEDLMNMKFEDFWKGFDDKANSLKSEARKVYSQLGQQGIGQRLNAVGLSEDQKLALEDPDREFARVCKDIDDNMKCYKKACNAAFMKSLKERQKFQKRKKMYDERKDQLNLRAEQLTQALKENSELLEQFHAEEVFLLECCGRNIALTRELIEKCEKK